MNMCEKFQRVPLTFYGKNVSQKLTALGKKIMDHDIQ